MNPAWIDTDGDDNQRQYVIIMEDGSAALGTMGTIADRVFCLLHYQEEHYRIKSVWRVQDGSMVRGVVTWRQRGSEVAVWLSAKRTKQQWGYEAFTL